MTLNGQHSGNQQKQYFEFFVSIWDLQGHFFLFSLIDHNMIQRRLQPQEDEIVGSNGNEKQ